MFQQGEFVMYGDSGLCLVEKVGEPDFSMSERGKQYYFLRVQADGGRIYVPTDTRMPLRPPITRQEAEALLTSLGDLPVAQPDSRDHKVILQFYQSLLRPHTSRAVAQTVKSMRFRHAGPGRMNSAEEALLKRAENQLCGELACALESSPEDARNRLSAALAGQQ